MYLKPPAGGARPSVCNMQQLECLYFSLSGILQAGPSRFVERIAKTSTTSHWFSILLIRLSSSLVPLFKAGALFRDFRR